MLDRTIALKFLPPGSTSHPRAKDRFFHEAKAASALAHDNICAIFEVNETEEGQLFLARRYDDAIEQLQKTIEMDPEFYDGHSWLGMAFLQIGQSDQALAKFEECHAFSPIKARMNASIAYIYAVPGRNKLARKLLAALLDDRSGETTDYCLTAVVYAGLGKSIRCWIAGAPILVTLNS